jgi:hypothetical protein
MSAISSACSPESGWLTSSSSMLTPSSRAYVGSSACSASMNAAIPPWRWASAMMCRQTVVLPEPSGPKTSTTRDPADPEGDIQSQRSRRDGLHLDVHRVFAELHNGSAAVLLLDLLERDLQDLVAVHAIPLPFAAHPGGGSSERTCLTFQHPRSRV